MAKKLNFKAALRYLLITIILLSASDAFALWENLLVDKEASRQKQTDQQQKQFTWWPTDATPAPVKDDQRSGYWWWPTNPGTMRPWGNRGYIYVNKIIFDYKEEELPAPKQQELRPSLLIKKIMKNVKIYFDYDKADLRDDASEILSGAVGTLKRNPETSILITGNCDIRGTEAYNEKLGKRRGETVKNFMLENGITQGRIKIVSRGKLDAVAHITDLVGMQKDRNAQFMIAEVEEIMIPYEGELKEMGATPIGDGEYTVEENLDVESEIKVSTKEYVVKEGDTLKKIAKVQLGAERRWKYLYEFNKENIKDPDAIEAGTVIMIPIEQQQQDEESPASVKRTYVIAKDDSLWKIAKKQLGDGNRWKEIYNLNKENIKNPDKLILGTKILLPEE
ncbi:MAG: LysM peptidoglycan-binding domain-containing protein [Candidatus Omnitrophota bacterium]